MTDVNINPLNPKVIDYSPDQAKFNADFRKGFKSKLQSDLVLFGLDSKVDAAANHAFLIFRNLSQSTLIDPNDPNSTKKYEMVVAQMVEREFVEYKINEKTLKEGESDDRIKETKVPGGSRTELVPAGYERNSKGKITGLLTTIKTVVFDVLQSYHYSFEENLQKGMKNLFPRSPSPASDIKEVIKSDASEIKDDYVVVPKSASTFSPIAPETPADKLKDEEGKLASLQTKKVRINSELNACKANILACDMKLISQPRKIAELNKKQTKLESELVAVEKRLEQTKSAIQNTDVDKMIAYQESRSERIGELMAKRSGLVKEVGRLTSEKVRQKEIDEHPDTIRIRERIGKSENEIKEVDDTIAENNYKLKNLREFRTNLKGEIERQKGDIREERMAAIVKPVNRPGKLERIFRPMFEGRKKEVGNGEVPWQNQDSSGSRPTPGLRTSQAIAAMNRVDAVSELDYSISQAIMNDVDITKSGSELEKSIERAINKQVKQLETENLIDLPDKRLELDIARVDAEHELEDKQKIILNDIQIEITALNEQISQIDKEDMSLREGLNEKNFSSKISALPLSSRILSLDDLEERKTTIQEEIDSTSKSIISIQSDIVKLDEEIKVLNQDIGKKAGALKDKGQAEDLPLSEIMKSCEAKYMRFQALSDLKKDKEYLAKLEAGMLNDSIDASVALAEDESLEPINDELEIEQMKQLIKTKEETLQREGEDLGVEIDALSTLEKKFATFNEVKSDLKQLQAFEKEKGFKLAEQAQLKKKDLWVPNEILKKANDITYRRLLFQHRSALLTQAIKANDINLLYNDIGEVKTNLEVIERDKGANKQKISTLNNELEEVNNAITSQRESVEKLRGQVAVEQKSGSEAGSRNSTPVNFQEGVDDKQQDEALQAQVNKQILAHKFPDNKLTFFSRLPADELREAKTTNAKALANEAAAGHGKILSKAQHYRELRKKDLEAKNQALSQQIEIRKEALAKSQDILTSTRIKLENKYRIKGANVDLPNAAFFDLCERNSEAGYKEQRDVKVAEMKQLQKGKEDDSSKADEILYIDRYHISSTAELNAAREEVSNNDLLTVELKILEKQKEKLGKVGDAAKNLGNEIEDLQKKLREISAKNTKPVETAEAAAGVANASSVNVQEKQSQMEELIKEVADKKSVTLSSYELTKRFN